MFQRRSLLLVVSFVGLASLACSGVATAPGSSGPLSVGKSDLKKGGAKAKGPSSSSLGSERQRDEYVVKLRPGVDGLNIGKGRVQAKDPKLTQAFGGLNLDSSSKVLSISAKDGGLQKYLGLDRTIHIKTKQNEAAVRKRLENHPDVEWVEPVVKVKAAGIPNDPYYQHQWHMQMLDVPKAWETTMGEGVVVAVIDTGVGAGKDGYHKLLQGYDFVDNDTDATDLNGHGTHVAGTIGQAANNGVGAVGVAPKVSILPVRVLSANGSGSNTWVANGIIWAADNGANIINLSLGSQMNSELVEDACAYAYEKGVTLVAATGNDGFVDYIGYPAALETTIAVGSVDAKKKVAFYSNQGRQIDLVAPGGDTTADTTGSGYPDGVLQEITSNGRDYEYKFLQGTSMATPHVAGVAALLYAQGVHSPDEIRRLMTSTADDLGSSGFDTVYGHGLVNPVKALAAAPGKVAGAPDRGRTPPASSKLVIEKKRGRNVGEGRAVVGWITNEASSTMIRGTDGFRDKSDTPVKMHRVAVNGKAGSTVTYTIRSEAAGGKQVTDTVVVKF